MVSPIIVLLMYHKKVFNLQSAKWHNELQRENARRGAGRNKLGRIEHLKAAMSLSIM